jgi:hypothetical protein
MAMGPEISRSTSAVSVAIEVFFRSVTEAEVDSRMEDSVWHYRFLKTSDGCRAWATCSIVYCCGWASRNSRAATVSPG